MIHDTLMLQADQAPSQRVIKRARHTEHYQAAKLRASIVAICRSVQTAVGSADSTAHQVCQAVEVWLKDKTEVTSAELRRVAAEVLHHHNPAAARLFASHLEVN